jgi:hypothetical protein
MALQKAKSGDNSELMPALEKQFGKQSWLQRKLSERPVGQVAKTASARKQAQFEMPVDIGYIERETPDWTDGDERDQFQRLDPNLDELEKPLEFEDDVSKYGDLINQLTSGIDVPEDEEIEKIKETDPEAFQDENKPQYVPKDRTDEDSELDLPEDFTVNSTQDINIGKTSMRQIVLSFDKYDFDDDLDVKHRAVAYLFSKYPSLFSFNVRGKPIEVSKNINIDMENGKITTTLPSAAFGLNSKRKMV